jgi:hypothetical protein
VVKPLSHINIRFFRFSVPDYFVFFHKDEEKAAFLLGRLGAFRDTEGMMLEKGWFG